MAFRDPVAKAWGDAAEVAVREVFQDSGRFVVPVHLIEDGGAPMLTGLLRKYVLPDFLSSRRGRCRWVEVKFKDHCVHYQKTGFWRHGIDLPKWRDYLTVQEETGIPGDIALLQYRPGPEANPEPFLFLQTFAHLATVADLDSRPQPHAPHGMAYWNVDEMECVCALDFNPTDLPLLQHKIHAWEQKSAIGNAPRMGGWQQRSLFSPASEADVRELLVRKAKL